MSSKLKYYIYRHIRLDNNEIFYIGQGSKNERAKHYSKETFLYERAYSKRGRNYLWKSIVDITDYIVEIMFESDDYDFIIEKEKEFIKLYGRKNLNQGTLCNLTDGGYENGNYIFTEQQLRKYSERMMGNKIMVGKKIPKEVTEKRIKTIQKPIIQYDLQGNIVKKWESVKHAEKEGFNSSNISRCCNGFLKTHRGYIWKFDK